MNLTQAAEAAKDYIIEQRRWFHQHPEVSEQEFESCKRIRAELDKMGVEWRPCGLETGTLATIKGAKPGKTILLRADMDGLTVQEDRPGVCQRGPRRDACLRPRLPHGHAADGRPDSERGEG